MGNDQSRILQASVFSPQSSVFSLQQTSVYSRDPTARCLLPVFSVHGLQSPVSRLPSSVVPRNTCPVATRIVGPPWAVVLSPLQQPPQSFHGFPHDDAESDRAPCPLRGTRPRSPSLPRRSFLVLRLEMGVHAVKTQGTRL